MSSTGLVESSANIDLAAVEAELGRRDPVYWAQDQGNFRLEDTGEPIQFARHQAAVLRYCLGRRPNGRLPFRLVLWSECKKSGKTTVSGAVIKWAAETWGQYGEILCVGNDADQAQERGFRKMTIAVEQTPGYVKERQRLPGVWQLHGAKRAVCTATGTIVKAVAKDYRGEAGGNPILSVWTELWGFIHKDDLRFWSEMAPSPTRPDSIRMVETYAGWEGESELLYSLYEQTVLEGRQLTAGELGDTSAFAEAPNADSPVPCYVNEAAGMFAYWDSGAQAHRQPWQQGVQGAAYYANEAASQTPANYSRLHHNEWASAESSFIDLTWWDGCQGAPIPLVPGDDIPLILAMDAAVTGDTFAVVVVSRDPERPGGFEQQGGVMLRSANLWVPVGGKPLDFGEVEKMVRAFCANHNVVQIAYDPYQLHDMATRLQQDGVAWCRAFGQGQERLIADGQLYQMIVQRRIRHDGAWPQVREHLSNANKKVSATEDTRLRIVKKSEGRKIDAVVALSMATAECLRLAL
jgi:phage terminase large subunit-like protein